MRERVFDPPQNDGSLLYPSKGKTMKPIISVEHLSKYYKINSAIRKKLGLGPTETNLDIYLRKLLSEIES